MSILGESETIRDRSMERNAQFILIGLVLLVTLAYGGAKAYIHFKASDGVDAAVMFLAPYASLEYGGISSTLSGELTIDEVRLKINGYRDDIYIGRLGIATPSFLTLLQLSDLAATSQGSDASRPEYFGIIAKEIRVPVTADYYRDLYEKNIKAIAPSDIRQRGVQCVGKYGYSPEALVHLGYDELIMSMSVIFRQADSHFITETDFDIVDMAKMEIEVTMTGSPMSAAMGGVAYLPSLHSMQVKLTDNSLNQRIQQYCTDLGLTQAQIQRAHLNALQYAGSTLGIKFDEYVTDPYKKYLNDKSIFIMTAKPRQPLQLTSISKYKPSDVPALLNLEASAQ